MRREFLNGVADDDDAVVKAFAHHNRESALKTKPKVWDCIICLFLSVILSFFPFSSCTVCVHSMESAPFGAGAADHTLRDSRGVGRRISAVVTIVRPGLIEFWAVSSHESQGNTNYPNGARGRARTEPRVARHETRHGCGRPRVRGLEQDQCSLALGPALVSWALTIIIFALLLTPALLVPWFNPGPRSSVRADFLIIIIIIG